VPDAIKSTVYGKCTKSKATVKICICEGLTTIIKLVVDRHLEFLVTTTRNIPGVELVLPTVRIGRLHKDSDSRNEKFNEKGPTEQQRTK
jgi:uncharacterized Zn finger protein